MKIILDLLHPAHLNFFKNALRLLEKSDYEIEVVFRSRDRLNAILAHELPDKKCLEIGIHHDSPYAKFFALFSREYRLLKYLRSRDFDMSLGVGFYIGYPASILGKPALSFTDDWEYKTTFYLSKYSADYLVIPSLIPTTGKGILKYSGYKELAYLHPNHYKPNKKLIKEKGLTPGKYIFIRLVSPVALNYMKVDEGNLVELFRRLKKEGTELVLSAEGLGKAERYSDTCLILEPPVDDIHSWLANAALTVTWGDTIARESCMLGTPSLYLGKREMAVNNELISMGLMKKIDRTEDIFMEAKSSLESDQKVRTDKMVHELLEKGKWIDTTQTIVDISKGVLEDNQELINKYVETA